MSRYNDELKLKLAWQAAYEQRTCPPADLLYAEVIDGNLQRHLSFCEACRENREMTQDEKAAWQNVFDKMARSAARPEEIERQRGQVWALRKSMGGWQKDGRYFLPPTVLLLRKQGEAFWEVAQLYSDKRLMGDGDVWLDDKFGFAQGWNIYTIRQDALECCHGSATDDQVAEVLRAEALSYVSQEEGSILWFFRGLEKSVGEVVVASARATASEVLHAETKELVPGLKLLVTEAREYVLDIAAETLILLGGTFKPALVVRGGATRNATPKLTEEQKQLIASHCPAIPIDFDVQDSCLLIKLKWFSETQPSQLTAKIVVDGISLENIDVDISPGTVKISSSDKRIRELRIPKNQNIRISASSECVSIIIFSGAK